MDLAAVWKQFPGSSFPSLRVRAQITWVVCKWLWRKMRCLPMRAWGRNVTKCSSWGLCHFCEAFWPWKIRLWKWSLQLERIWNGTEAGAGDDEQQSVTVVAWARFGVQVSETASFLPALGWCVVFFWEPGHKKLGISGKKKKKDPVWIWPEGLGCEMLMLLGICCQQGQRVLWQAVRKHRRTWWSSKCEKRGPEMMISLHKLTCHHWQEQRGMGWDSSSLGSSAGALSSAGWDCAHAQLSSELLPWLHNSIPGIPNPLSHSTPTCFPSLKGSPRKSPQAWVSLPWGAPQSPLLLPWWLNSTRNEKSNVISLACANHTEEPKEIKKK